MVKITTREYFDGDVKYHESTADKVTRSVKKININLAPNPSQSWNGRCRYWRNYKSQARQIFPGKFSSLPIAVHGDAAIAGQGTQAEIIQMAQLVGTKQVQYMYCH
jgi:2-oxoglutarate dehydrogenase E1 component